MNALNKWKSFLSEGGHSTFPYQIYCDMDGVLVNFQDGVIDYVNNSLQNVENGNKYKEKLRTALDRLGREHKITIKDISFDKSIRLKSARNYMYKLVGNNREFWANLKWMPEGKAVWSYIKKFNPIILSAPMSGEGSSQGKFDWLKRNLGIDESKVILTHDKFKHATENSLLIDDMLKFLDPWIEAGGEGIHHHSAQTTIEKLKEIAGNGGRIDEEDI